MWTLNQIINKLQTIATNHKQINDFGFGDLWEVEQDRPLKGAAMWAVLRSATRDRKILTISITLVFMDLVNPDERNETEVLSDQLLTATDVLTLLDDEDSANDFTIELTSNLDPFTERFSNEWTGWTCDVSFKLNYLSALCEVPTL